MGDLYNPYLKEPARALRSNMTPEEAHLWYDFLQGLPVTFKRQKILGPYIVDFFCFDAKLVIELDGAHHFTSEGKENDAARDAFMNSLGLTVLRCPNSRINHDFDAVCGEITQYISHVPGFPRGKFNT